MSSTVAVVAYLSNDNGMATWCWEAARALQSCGRSVVLVCSPNARLPGEPSFHVVRFRPPEHYRPINAFGLISRGLGRVRAKSRGLLPSLHTHLLTLGLQPECYFLNSAGLQDRRLDVPQLIVAWAYPTSLMGYVRKAAIVAPKRFSLARARETLDLIGWYRTDHLAYREASGVLAVTNRLRDSLTHQGCRASTVYPGTALNSGKPLVPSSPVRLVIIAADLDEPRKRVNWMLRALRTVRAHYDLVLIGNASAGLRAETLRTHPNCQMPGRLRRDEAQALLSTCDVFLFGSLLDDWGYVIVEAMAQGLAAVVPNRSPFDEIVGDAGQCYDPDDPDSFASAVTNAVGDDCLHYKQRSLDRTQQRLSTDSFGNALLEAFAAAQPCAPNG